MQLKFLQNNKFLNSQVNLQAIRLEIKVKGLPIPTSKQKRFTLKLELGNHYYKNFQQSSKFKYLKYQITTTWTIIIQTECQNMYILYTIFIVPFQRFLCIYYTVHQFRHICSVLPIHVYSEYSIHNLFSLSLCLFVSEVNTISEHS